MRFTLAALPVVTALAAAAAAAAFAPAAAQTAPPTPPAPRVGVLAGVNSATLAGNLFDGFDGDRRRRTGLAAGAYLTLPLGGAFAFRPELRYSQQGVRQTFRSLVDDVLDDPADVRLALDYVELPLLLQVAPAAAAGVRPQLYAGPAVALRARCRLEVRVGGVTQSSDCRAPDGEREELTRRFDVGGVVGGAVAFGAGGRALTVGARYTHGFTNVSDVDGTTLRNRAVGLYGSLEFPLARRR